LASLQVIQTSGTERKTKIQSISTERKKSQSISIKIHQQAALESREDKRQNNSHHFKGPTNHPT
jgi:hypothetical protein